MKEVQDSELLATLRKKSEVGEKILEEAMKGARGPRVMISGIFIQRESLKQFQEILAEAKTASTIDNLKQILTEETIPMGLLFLEDFWKEFQNDIYELKNL